MSHRVKVITGPRGSGKTSLCQGEVARARRLGADVAGVITLRQGGEGRAEALGRPARLVVIDLRSGSAALLARWEAGRWALSEDGLQAGLSAIMAATPCDLLVIDEMGPLELLHGRGWAPAIAVLASGSYASAWVTVRLGLVQRFREQLRSLCLERSVPEPPCEVLELALAGGSGPDVAREP